MARPSRIATKRETRFSSSGHPSDTPTLSGLQPVEIQRTVSTEPGVAKSEPRGEKRKAGEEEDYNDKLPSKKKPRKKMASAVLPLAHRTVGMKMFVGAHVSMAKGLEQVPFC